MPNGGLQWGDVGTWVAAIGTWAVGAVAAIIAARQYRQSSFRPRAKAFYDGDKRLVIQIINEASGNGLVQDVNLLVPGHPRAGSVRSYVWEVADQTVDQRLVPFVLPGQASARLVLRPKNTDLTGIRVRVDYGNGKDSGCIKIMETSGHIYGSTYIPNRQP
jgi:hypothetical protein